MCWNVAGLRACLKRGSLDWIKDGRYDMICLQETKALESEEVEARLIGTSVSDCIAAVDSVRSEEGRVAGIIQTLSLDHPTSDKLTLDILNKAQDSGVRYAHELVKYITNEEWEVRPRVFFLTRGTMPAERGGAIPHLASAPITGLLRVANNEHPEFLWAQIDLATRENC